MHLKLVMGVIVSIRIKRNSRGLITVSCWKLSPFLRQTFKVDSVSLLYPECYILKVNDSNSVATTPLEEWICYLNTGDIPKNITPP